MARKDSVVDLECFRVPQEQLRWECDAECLGFQSTEEITPLEDHVFINQPRAELALETWMSVPGHMFVVTPDGSITSVLIESIRKKIDKLPKGQIHDRVCVYNRSNPERPGFILLQKGEAVSFRLSVKKLLESLRHKILSTFNSNECLEKRQLIFMDFEANVNKTHRVFYEAWKEAVVEADEVGNLTFFVPKGQDGKELVDSFGNVVVWVGQFKRGIMPGHENEGEVDIYNPFPILPKFKELLEESKKEIERKVKEKVEEIQVAYWKMSGEISRLSEAMRREIEQTRAVFVSRVFQEEAADIIVRYGEAVFPFTETLREHTIENAEAFLPQEQDQSMQHQQPRPDPFGPFEVNVFVDNSEMDGVPIIDNRNPTYERLFGEAHISPHGNRQFFGDPNWYHMMVRAGALSEAEGGYLILPARAVLSELFVWQRLRGVLESKRLDIGAGGLGKDIIDPETLPVNVRVVLVGDYATYRAMQGNPWMRQDLEGLFRVVAQFDWEAPRTEEIMGKCARFIRLLCDRGGLPYVSDGGIAEILQYMSRNAGAKDAISLDGRSVKEIIHEAAFWHSKNENLELPIMREDIKKAFYEREHRLDMVREKGYKNIKDGTLLISLDGSEVGQINGLAVYNTGDFSFGYPTRITCNTFSGGKGVINIERDVSLSGAIHDKGVVILSGYLGGKYAQEKPLGLSASLCFEQSYFGVEGDSASSAELYAILSSLSGLPLRQDIAVTGSMNQKGEIQPIGGVNQKIEGMFDVCSLFGLTGNQGVIIPHQNIRNLMLRQDVVEAIKERRFHVYAVQTVDEGMEILTGRKVGEKIIHGERKGQYRKNTVNFLVDKRLKELSDSPSSIRPK